MIETKSNKAYFDNYEKTEYGFNAIGKEHTGYSNSKYRR